MRLRFARRAPKKKLRIPVSLFIDAASRWDASDSAKNRERQRRKRPSS